MQNLNGIGMAAYGSQNSDENLDPGYMELLGLYPTLSVETLFELFNRFRQENDRQARDTIILHNQRLVVGIARKYHHYNNLPMMDRVSEGNLGLMRAVEEFDVNLGYAFSNYATVCIRSAIKTAAIDKGVVIRLPRGSWQNICHLRRAIASGYSTYGRRPTTEELGVSLGWSAAQVEQYSQLASAHNWKLYGWAEQYRQAPIPLSQVRSKSPFVPLQSLMAEESLQHNLKVLRKLITKLLTRKAGRHLQTFVMLYGMIDASFEPKTQTAVAPRLRRTRASISLRFIEIWKVLANLNEIWTEEWLLELLADTRVLLEAVNPSISKRACKFFRRFVKTALSKIVQ